MPAFTPHAPAFMPAVDLEGRPLTRGAQRPPSRIQINLTAGGGGLGSTGLDALSHSSYASAVAVSASPVPGMAQYRRSSIEASSRGGAGGRPASSALSLARVPALGSTAPKTPPTTADGQRAGAPQPRSENRNGRGVGVPFPGGTRGYPSSSSRTRGTVLGSGGMGAGPGRLPGSGPLGRSQANIFKVGRAVLAFTSVHFLFFPAFSALQQATALRTFPLFRTVSVMFFSEFSVIDWASINHAQLHAPPS